ncbi:hypothetical protein MKX03_009250, partial [Papaver bracteatum]
MTFMCKATIIGVVPGSTWYYMVCSECNTMRVTIDGKSWCNVCNCWIKRCVP